MTSQPSGVASSRPSCTVPVRMQPARQAPQRGCGAAGPAAAARRGRRGPASSAWAVIGRLGPRGTDDGASGRIRLRAGRPRARQCARSAGGSAAAERGPRARPSRPGSCRSWPRRRPRSPPAAWPSSGSCRSRPRRSRGSARSGRRESASATSQACGLVGASPNHTVAWPLASARHHVVHPQQHAVRVLGALARSSRCRTSPWSPRRAGRPRPAAVGAEQVHLVLPGRPDVDVAGGERADLVGQRCPSRSAVGRLGLEQLDRRVELRLVELVRVLDPELRACSSSGAAPRRR